MAYDNNSRKFVAVINRKHPLPIILNALAHSAIGLSAKTGGQEQLLDYPNAASGFAAKISEYPFIMLEAKNSNQLRTLFDAAKEDNTLVYNVFTTSMIGASAQAQIDATRAAAGDALDFVVVVLFGEREQLDPLTKKFSLVKAAAPAVTAEAVN
jgi:hypothetical protein